MNKEDAIKLIYQTFVGSAKLFRNNTGKRYWFYIICKELWRNSRIQILNLHLPKAISLCLKTAIDRLKYLKELDNKNQA